MSNNAKTIVLNADKKPHPDFANLATEDLKVRDLKGDHGTCWCIYKHADSFAQNFTHNKCVAMASLPFQSVNQLANLFLNSYSKHLGIYLRPEDFHLHFVMLVSSLINEKPEAFRSIFTESAEGEKKKLVVNLQGLEDEARARNVAVWDLAMREWANMLGENVKVPEFINAVRTTYSTNTFVDNVVNDICVMDTMKAFFTFEGTCECGFPAVTLEGDEKDWITLIETVKTITTILDDKSLSRYVTTKFIPVLDMMLRTYRNVPEDQKAIREYWSKCICARKSYGSGYSSPDFSGWIVDLFPFVYDKKVALYRLNSLDKLKSSIVSTPIHINDNGNEFDLDARSGAVGLYQHNDQFRSLAIVNGYYLIKYSTEEVKVKRAAYEQEKKKNENRRPYHQKVGLFELFEETEDKKTVKDAGSWLHAGVPEDGFGTDPEHYGRFVEKDYDEMRAIAKRRKIERAEESDHSDHSEEEN